VESRPLTQRKDIGMEVKTIIPQPEIKLQYLTCIFCGTTNEHVHDEWQFDSEGNYERTCPPLCEDASSCKERRNQGGK